MLDERLDGAWRVAPRERAAVALKDVFDLSPEEIAQTLSTSIGAVKAALHRGRGGSLSGVLLGTRAGLLARPPRIEIRVRARRPRGGARDLARRPSKAIESRTSARTCTSPEVLAELCAELHVPLGASGHRWW